MLQINKWYKYMLMNDKLQITCVVEDDKVGTDLLEEEITKFEDFVQSVDVAAFNKI
uniref:Translation elongation factor EF1B beta/delta subunit guanine nucleotide exchange domain-containing protein n=1 Tax=Cynoglossus semilaevis TaxID=244447 RepID=A0A3P8WU09_CYNSE